MFFLKFVSKRGEMALDDAGDDSPVSLKVHPLAVEFVAVAMKWVLPVASLD